MPTYQYKREDGTEFEQYQNMNDEPLEECPETGQPVKRVITGGLKQKRVHMTKKRTSVEEKKEKLGDKGTSLNDYWNIQERQMARYKQKKAEGKLGKKR